MSEIREKIVEKTIYIKECETCGNDFEVTKEGGRVCFHFLEKNPTECIECVEERRAKEEELAEQEAEENFQEKYAKYSGAKITKISKRGDSEIDSIELVTPKGKSFEIYVQTDYEDDSYLSIMDKENK